MSVEPYRKIWPFQNDIDHTHKSFLQSVPQTMERLVIRLLGRARPIVVEDDLNGSI